jgi:hypothetical protein
MAVWELISDSFVAFTPYIGEISAILMTDCGVMVCLLTQPSRLAPERLAKAR